MPFGRHVSPALRPPDGPGRRRDRHVRAAHRRDDLTAVGGRHHPARRGGGAGRRARHRRSATGARRSTSTSSASGPIRARSDRHLTWGRQFGAALQPFSRGVYINEMGSEGDERIRAAYNAANYARLVTLKNQYDPTNFWRMNQNIKPTV